MIHQRTIDATSLAKILDVTPRYVRQLTRDGILSRARDRDGNELRGRYSLLSVREYCRYLRSLMRLDDSSEQRWSALRNEKLAAENELTQLTLAERKGQLHNSDDVEFVMTQMLTAFKARTLAIPARVSRLLIGKTNFREIFDIIMREIEQCLLELSGYDESKFEKENREYLASKGIDLSALDEPPAAA
jgi:phage terminase Nu1 subunit (DNA packaging protein)